MAQNPSEDALRNQYLRGGNPPALANLIVRLAGTPRRKRTVMNAQPTFGSPEWRAKYAKGRTITGAPAPVVNVAAHARAGKLVNKHQRGRPAKLSDKRMPPPGRAT